MSRILKALLLCALLVITGCAPKQAAAPAQVKLAMGFVPNVQFTPLYVAQERGYFAAEGLDVTFDYGMETDLLKLLGTNQLQFVIGSGDQVALARAQGLPVRYVVNWYRRFPVCVVALPGSGIEQPADLAGRTVGIPVLEGASYIGWRAFLEAVSMTPEQVNLQVIGYTQAASLTEQRVDAAVCYAMNEPVVLEVAGQAPQVLYLDSYTNLPSNGLISNDATIEQHPEMVRGMTRAFLHGLRDTLDDPDAAFAIAKKHVPSLAGEGEALQRAVLDECLEFWRGDPLGKSDPAAWRAAVDLLTRLNLLTAPLDPETLYTNEFVE